MKNPLKLFYNYIDFSILCLKIATKSLWYVLQKGCHYTVIDTEIETFIGITYFMGLKKLPAERLFKNWRVRGFHLSITPCLRDRYEIKKNLHFSNKLDHLYANNKASEIWPLMEHFNIAYQQNETNVSNHSIDEHVVKFKGHSSMNQYVKNKTIKRGFRFWLWCDATIGYVYEFDIYTGQIDGPELGLGENVVLDLTKKLHQTGISVFIDKYFSSPTLAALLHDQGMNFVGVVRKDRKGLPSFKDDKNMQRGESEMFYCKEGNMMAIKWIDNKSVHVISSLICSNMSSAERRVKSQKEKLCIRCPDLIEMYNKNFGGVDIRYGTVRREVGCDTIISLWFLKAVRNKNFISIFFLTQASFYEIQFFFYSPLFILLFQ